MAGSLFISLVFSLFGAAYFLYGKREAEAHFMVAGLLLCILPYFISSVVGNIATGAALIVAPLLWQRYYN